MAEFCQLSFLRKSDERDGKIIFIYFLFNFIFVFIFFCKFLILQFHCNQQKINNSPSIFPNKRCKIGSLLLEYFVMRQFGFGPWPVQLSIIFGSDSGHVYSGLDLFD